LPAGAVRINPSEAPMVVKGDVIHPVKVDIPTLNGPVLLFAIAGVWCLLAAEWSDFLFGRLLRRPRMDSGNWIGAGRR
jgi:hypothetical protein